MAKVVAKVLGGQPQELEADTVGDLKEELGLENHSASVNGNPVTDEYELKNFEFVTFAPSVKGG